MFSEAHFRFQSLSPTSMVQGEEEMFRTYPQMGAPTTSRRGHKSKYTSVDKEETAKENSDEETQGSWERGLLITK